MSTPDVQPVETEQETKPAVEETSAQPAQQSQADGPTDVTHWVKAKMTTSIPVGVQAAIRELAPGKVVNISQFIAWLLDDYYRLQKENKVYDENQEILNTKLLQANELIAELKEEYGKLHELHAAVQEKSKGTPETPPVPVATSMQPAKQEKKQPTGGDFMNLLGW